MGSEVSPSEFYRPRPSYYLEAVDEPVGRTEQPAHPLSPYHTAAAAVR